MVDIFKYINIEKNLQQNNLNQVMMTIIAFLAWCIIFKKNGELVNHFIVHCLNTNEVWDEAIEMTLFES